MEYCSQTVILKNGEECLLRCPTGEDAAEILRHLILTSGQTDNMARNPDEIRMTEQEEAEYLERLRVSDRELLLAAYIGGELAASAGFNPVSTLERCRHRATFGISVKQAYWGRGVASALLAACIAAARDIGYRQLELDVVTSNIRAISLYSKYGFSECGTIPRGFRYRDGREADLCMMVLPL